MKDAHSRWKRILKSYAVTELCATSALNEGGPFGKQKQVSSILTALFSPSEWKLEKVRRIVRDD